MKLNWRLIVAGEEVVFGRTRYIETAFVRAAREAIKRRRPVKVEHLTTIKVESDDVWVETWEPAATVHPDGRVTRKWPELLRQLGARGAA